MQAPCPEAKIILLGEFGVGKTSIFRRYSQGTFVDTSGMDWSQYRESTLGLDNYSKRFECRLTGGGGGGAGDLEPATTKTLSLRLFDTGGLERIGSISNSYYKFSDAALLVFARNNLDSFNCLTQHLLEALSMAENAKIYLVSNKVDLGEREVSDQDIQSFMEQFPNIERYFQVSCKTNQPSVDEMFCQIAHRIANSVSNKLAQRLGTIKLIAPAGNSAVRHRTLDSTATAGPSYEYQYERNGADVYSKQPGVGGSCSPCMSL